MAGHERIEDLRRRVARDPTSIAFAQLGEELRRAGELPEAIETCRAGLATHPGYISARVTLGRALIVLGRLDDAQEELERVLRGAPENLAAIRGLADIYSRRGNTREALVYFRTALSLASNDPELQEAVAKLTSDSTLPTAAGGADTPIPICEHGTTIVSGRPEPASLPLAPAASEPLRLNADAKRHQRTVAALQQFLEAVRSRGRENQNLEFEIQNLE